MRKSFTTFQKSLLVLVVFGIFTLGILAFTTKAGTQLGVTLNLASTAGGLERGLVGHWTFDGDDMPSGQVNDRSGTANHGSQRNMATSTAYTNGVLGQALRFDGTNDYIQMSASPFDPQATDFSVSLWFKYPNPTISGDPSLIAQADGTGTGRTWIEIDSTGVIQSRLSGGTHSSSYTITKNRWTHVVLIHNNSGNTLTWYADGVQTAQVTGVTPESATGNLQLAAPKALATNFLNGMLDDVRVYSRILSTDEIKQLYQLGATTKVGTTPDTTAQANTGLNFGLVGHYTFDGADMPGGQVNDASGMGNHGNAIAMSTSTAYVKGAIGQALNFDGANDYVRVDAAADDFTADFSLSAWIKFLPICTSTKICSVIGRNVSNFNNNFIFTVGDNVGGSALDNQLAMHDGSSSAFEGDTDTVVADNTWHQVGYSLSGTTGTLYVDGIAKSTHTLNSTRNATDLVSIGQEWDTGPAASDFGIGSIDDVRFYSRAITADEMKQLYQLGATTKVGTTPAPSNQKTGLNFGIVGHWTFDGKDMAGGQANDISGNNYHGTAVSISTSTLYTKGRIGQALWFDGVDDRISLVNNVSVRNQSQASVSLWFNADTLNGSTQVLYEEQNNIAQNQSRYSLRIHTTNKIRFGGRAPDTDGFTTWVDSTVTLAPKTWYHVVGVFNADTDVQTVYINGVAESASVSEPAFDDSAPTIAPRVGARSGADFFPGRIDDVRIYHRALTADEAKQLYDMGR